MSWQFGTYGGTHSALTLGVPEGAWQARLTTWGSGSHLLEAEQTVVLSLPTGLFVEHDAAMRRMGAHRSPVARSDAEYLSDVWGFTRLGGEDCAEIGDVPHVALGMRPRGIVVELSGVPWLYRSMSGIPAAERERLVGEAGVLMGICFDVDIESGGADERFMSDLADGEAVLGQVAVEGRM